MKGAQKRKEAAMVTEAVSQIAAGQISSNNDRIGRDRAALESLGWFRTDVENSKDAFNSMNSGNTNLLYRLEAIKGRCKIAARYQSGMSTTLSSIGSGIVGVAFGGLLASIKVKELAYQAHIGQLETENALLSAAVSEAE